MGASPDIRAALDWGLEKNIGGVLRLVPSLERFWNRQGHEEEGRQIIREALARAEKLPVPVGEEAALQWKQMLGRAWASLAALAYSQGDNVRAADSAARAAALAREVGDKGALALVLAFEASSLTFVAETEKALKILEEAVAAGRESGDKRGLALALTFYAQVLTMMGTHPDVASKYSEEGATLRDESGDRWFVTMGLLAAAMTARFRGNYPEARERFAAAGALFDDLGDRHRMNMVRSELAHIDRYEGKIDEAERVYRETILEWKRLGHRAAIAHQLESFAAIALTRKDYVRAARLYGAAGVLRDQIGISMTPLEKVEYEGLVAGLRSSMDEKTFAAAWAGGQALSMDDAIKLALERPARGN